jgi:hypothetical protein
VASVVQIATEADTNSMVENRDFKNAVIVGPAVLIPLKNVALRNSSFDGPEDAIFIELREDQTVVGFIGLQNVTFDACRFQNVALAGTAESIAKIRKGFASQSSS